MAVNQPGEAEEALREALRLDRLMGRKLDQYDYAFVQFRLAQLLANSGRTEEASHAVRESRQSLEGFAQKLLDEPECISRLVVVLTMSPIPELRDPNRAVALAVRALPDSSGHYWRYRALAQYRTRQWVNAMQSAHEAMSRLEGGDSIDRFILAMATSQNGNRVDAQHWFDEAIGRLERGESIMYHDLGSLAVQHLREEAERMITADASDESPR